jgi:hypothetical protein
MFQIQQKADSLRHHFGLRTTLALHIDYCTSNEAILSG